MLGSGKTVKRRDGEKQREENAHHFDSKRIVHKEFLLVGRTVNSAYSCDGDCVKMCEDFAPNFSDKRTG
jgi:hypothetical protein